MPIYVRCEVNFRQDHDLYHEIKGFPQSSLFRKKINRAKILAHTNRNKIS